MGVLIGDDPVANLPSFVIAASDGIFDRLKNKFYERFNLPVQLVQRKAEKIRVALLTSNAAEKTKVTDGSFLLDASVYRRRIWDRLLLLDVKKAGERNHRLLVS